MNYVELWCNNDNNDNTHAGAKFDAGGGAETSFPLTVTLLSLWLFNWNTIEIVIFMWPTTCSRPSTDKMVAFSSNDFLYPFSILTVYTTVIQSWP